MLYCIVKWLEQQQQPCFFKKFIGIECLGCGFQTALIALLKGNIWESIQAYPALLPFLFTVVFLILHLIFKLKKGALIIKISFIFTSLIIVINYIYKLIV